MIASGTKSVFCQGVVVSDVVEVTAKVPEDNPYMTAFSRRFSTYTSHCMQTLRPVIVKTDDFASHFCMMDGLWHLVAENAVFMRPSHGLRSRVDSQFPEYRAHVASQCVPAHLQLSGNLPVVMTVGEQAQNGHAKRLMRTIKEEEVNLSEYHDYADVYAQIGRFLDDVYTHKRICLSLGYLTPAEFESQWGAQQVAS